MQNVSNLILLFPWTQFLLVYIKRPWKTQEIMLQLSFINTFSSCLKSVPNGHFFYEWLQALESQFVLFIHSIYSENSSNSLNCQILSKGRLLAAIFWSAERTHLMLWLSMKRNCHLFICATVYFYWICNDGMLIFSSFEKAKSNSIWIRHLSLLNFDFYLKIKVNWKTFHNFHQSTWAT